ncbi:MAG: hypothetical protein U9N73_13265, partial [Candidatus Auribacterota bacterium]|nr:hypothetical protein [Candidatus Auribacterota bacterium]
MNIKPKFWERIEEYPLWRLMAYVFLLALSERLIVNLIFFLRWGWHTVSGIELWFYYGVAKGTFDLYSVWDPTWWILSGLGAIVSGPALLYGTYLVSSLSSSLNAALFCLFVSELHNKKTGFLAGILYGSMVLPMFNSAGTVTHDIFAYPYLVLSMYGILMAFKRRGWIRLLYGGICVIALFLGMHVGPTILVGAGTVLVYLIWQGALALFRQWHQKGYLVFGVFLAVTVGILLLIYFTVMPAMMEKMFDLAQKTRGIDVRAQIKAGSGDLLASSLGDYWLRFNFLLFFLPVGIWIAVKKKNMLGLALIMVAFLASRTADRGTRPLTFGFALMGALAFVNWKSIYGWLLALWMCFIIGEFGGKYSTEYAVFFPVAALVIFYSIQWPGLKRRTFLSSIILILSLLGLLAGFILLASPGLRESLGFFSLPRVPGGLLRIAPGFSYLFVVFSLLTIGALVYMGKLWIANNRAPVWIWAIFSLTALWLLAGAFLGGALFQAKHLGNPEILKQMDGFKSLSGQSQMAAINTVLMRIKSMVEIIRRYWTVQICLVIPGLLLLLETVVRRPRIPETRKERKKSLSYVWLRKPVVRQSLFIAIGLLVFTGIIGILRYIGLFQGEPLFPSEGFLNQAVVFFWNNLKYFFAAAVGLIIFILSWPRRAERESNQYLTGVAVVCWLFATIIPSMNQTAKSTEGEYLTYKWLNDNARGRGRVFVPWSDGYMAEAISGLPSELSPQNIDFNLPRLYWMPEEASARILAGKGLEYIVVSTKYFKLIRYNKKTGEFQYSFSPDIIYQPQRVGINNVNELKPTTLYRLLYKHQELTNFKLIHFE